MLVGGLVLWAYGGRHDLTGAMALMVTGPEAEATRAFHSHLAHWFFVYGMSVITLGAMTLAGAALSL